jgi:hypothetical protein
LSTPKTTADQLFEEAQLEDYRELSYHLGKQLLEANEEKQWIPLPPASPNPMVTEGSI